MRKSGPNPKTNPVGAAYAKLARRPVVDFRRGDRVIVENKAAGELVVQLEPTGRMYTLDSGDRAQITYVGGSMVDNMHLEHGDGYLRIFERYECADDYEVEITRAGPKDGQQE